jgi:hypothetical protein
MSDTDDEIDVDLRYLHRPFKADTPRHDNSQLIVDAWATIRRAEAESSQATAETIQIMAFESSSGDVGIRFLS